MVHALAFIKFLFCSRRRIFGDSVGLEASVEPYFAATTALDARTSSAESSRDNASAGNLFRLFGARHSISLSNLKVYSDSHECVAHYYDMLLCRGSVAIYLAVSTQVLLPI
jgi:hypothetical protein